VNKTFETLRYEIDGPVATVTLARPEAANAQNTTMLDELDAAFDLADADDAVRVVVLAADGRHWSAGHDLKELLTDPDDWARLRETPEGKWRHEEVMYFGRCVRIRDFRKPTVAAVQGKCVAAGMMLACMCDLIVAADDAVFSNPVLRMTGAGVELLVEPWEIGIRKAKEFLLLAQEIDAAEAWRLGLVNRVVPRDLLAGEAAEVARQVALVPPETAMRVKESINHAADLMGQRDSWKYHFALHQYVSNTKTATDAMAARKAKGSIGDVIAEQRGPADPADPVDPGA
jgi:enoyl-CoA hydratase